jgi:hypothetical protein
MYINISSRPTEVPGTSPLRPRYRMALPQPDYICRIFAPFHLAYGTKAHRATERFEDCMNVPGPDHGGSEERHKQRRHDIALPQGQNAYHECLEDDDAPNQPNERERPCLTLRFVGLIEY